MSQKTSPVTHPRTPVSDPRTPISDPRTPISDPVAAVKTLLNQKNRETRAIKVGIERG